LSDSLFDSDDNFSILNSVGDVLHLDDLSVAVGNLNKVLANHKPLSPEKVAWLKKTVKEIDTLIKKESKSK
jgi:hypothetical protein